MPVRLTILGSGSSGNCAYVETDETRVPIEAGFSLRQIRPEGVNPEVGTGVMIERGPTSSLPLSPFLA